MTKQKIFFSYARADGSAFALRLAVDLKQKGFDVWMDQEDIRAGSDWDIEIEKALETCDCLLFIETEKSVVSNNVLDEVYYALEQNKKVIPVISIDSKTPFRLKRLQHIDFTKDYNTGLALLINELEGNTIAATYLQEETKPVAIFNKPVNSKYTALPLIVGALVILIAALYFFTSKNKSTSTALTEQANVAQDTATTNPAITAAERHALPKNYVDTNEGAIKSVTPIITKKKAITKTSNGANQKTQGQTSTVLPGKTAATAAPESDNLNELYAGDWRLVSVEPKAQSQRGYLKIEVQDEKKVSIKSYMQFYYPERKATSYLTIFNAFANCNSCVLNNDVKLIAEDIAVGSRTIKTLKEDQPGGGKAGDVIMDANSNKSIRASVALHFIDENNAVIKVKQPVTIALSHELMLEPFVYTFRFRKND